MSQNKCNNTFSRLLSFLQERICCFVKSSSVSSVLWVCYVSVKQRLEREPLRAAAVPQGRRTDPDDLPDKIRLPNLNISLGLWQKTWDLGLKGKEDLNMHAHILLINQVLYDKRASQNGVIFSFISVINQLLILTVKRSTCQLVLDIISVMSW